MSSESNASGNVANWLSRQWWLSGVITCASLIALVSNITALSRFETLTLFVAVGLDYRELVNLLIDWVAQYVPWFQFDANAVIAFKLAMITVTPAVPIMMNAGLGDPSINSYKNLYSKPDLFLWLCFVALFGLGLIFIIEFFEGYHSTSGASVATKIFRWLVMAIAAMWLPALFFLNLIRSKSFRFSLVFLLGFLITTVCLYWLSTPALSDALKEYTCEAFERHQISCIPES